VLSTTDKAVTHMTTRRLMYASKQHALEAVGLRE
jgi:hypothetical protein